MFAAVCEFWWRHGSFICVSRRIHTRDMMHAHAWRDPFRCVTRRIHMCDMTHSYVWNDSFTCVIRRIHKSHMIYSHVRHDAFVCVPWLIRMYDMTHSYVWDVTSSYVWRDYSYAWRDLFVCVTQLIHMCDMTHSYVWHDLCIRVSWLVCTSDIFFVFCGCAHFKKHLAYSFICDMCHSCMTWLIHALLALFDVDVRALRYVTCDLTRSYVTWLIHTCDVTHLYVKSARFYVHMCSSSFVTCDMNHSYVTWLINTCDVTHVYDVFALLYLHMHSSRFVKGLIDIWSDLFIGESHNLSGRWCDMRHSYVCFEICDMTHSHVTWFIHTWHDPCTPHSWVTWLSFFVRVCVPTGRGSRIASRRWCTWTYCNILQHTSSSLCAYW